MSQTLTPVAPVVEPVVHKDKLDSFTLIVAKVNAPAMRAGNGSASQGNAQGNVQGNVQGGPSVGQPSASGGSPPPTPPDPTPPDPTPPDRGPGAQADASPHGPLAESFVAARCRGVKAELTIAHRQWNARLPGDKQTVLAFADDAPVIKRVAAKALTDAGVLATDTPVQATEKLTAKQADIDKQLNDALRGPVADVEKRAKAIKPDETKCMKVMEDAGWHWKDVKKQCLETPDLMWQMIQFRQQTVDGLLAELNGKNGNQLIAKSVGSTNLTSDYDITLSTKDNSGKELDAIREFNKAIKAKLHAPPGVCFDTNLYAKDFLKVKDNVLVREGEEVDDGAAIAAINSFTAEDVSDQDVGALTKQRQYLGAQDWDTFKDSVLKPLEGDADKLRQARYQFEEAETLYITKCIDKTKPLVDVLTKKAGSLGAPEVEAEAKDLIAQWQKALSNDQEVWRCENLADVIAEFAHEHAESETLEVNNDVYLDKMTAARDIQDKHRKLEALLGNGAGPDFEAAKAQLSAKDQQELATLLTGQDGPAKAKAFLEKKVDGLKARAKKEITEANFFASEAYLSEGPLQHIVNGKQSSNPAVFETLKPEHFLGSINEQFGDFMKDVGHYKSNPKEAFCQTSKYIERMFDGIILLRKKEAFAALELSTFPVAEIEKKAAEIKSKLLPIRGSSGAYAEMSDADRFDAAAREAAAIYGVSDFPALVTKMKALATEVNAKVRAAVSMRPSAEEVGRYAGASRT